MSNTNKIPKQYQKGAHLIVDGSYKNGVGAIGIVYVTDGAINTHWGKLLTRCFDNMDAELQAVYQGLKWLQAKRLTNCTIWSDCQILQAKQHQHKRSPMWQEIQLLLYQLNTQIKHTPRKNVILAHREAKNANTQI